MDLSEEILSSDDKLEFLVFGEILRDKYPIIIYSWNKYILNI